MTGERQGAARDQALTAGEECYRAGAYANAASIFRARCAARPSDAAAWRMLGMCRLRLGAVAEGLELLGKARALMPGDPYAELHYGLGLHEAGRHAEAADQFRLCQSLLPGDPAPHLNLAAALLAMGEAVPAVDAARRARRRAPAMPQTHYMLGLALLAADRLDEAEEASEAALRLDPGMADASVNIGVARYRRGDIEGAQRAMRQALAAQPAHRGAAANLGAFLRLTGQADDSERLLHDVLARDPEAMEVRLNLAVGLLQEGRAPDALALLDEEAPAEPRLAQHWALQRSLALLQCGRTAEARATLDAFDAVAPDLRPLVSWRRALLAEAEGDEELALGHAAEMGQALGAAQSILPEHRVMAHYDLARFWSARGEADRAFPHWSEAHRLLARFQPFSREAHHGFVEATIAEFGRDRLHRGPRARNRDPAPVFIVGMPRSGTTLAEQIVGAHNQAFAAGERIALGAAFGALGGGQTADAAARVAALDADRLDRAAEAYLRELHALAPGAARIVDKMPGNFNYLGLVGLMLPGARVIHCTRDPRDIGLSIFTFRFYGHHPYAHDLADLGWYIAEHERLMAQWRAALPNPVLTLPLGDWVEDFSGTLRRVLDFLDLPYDPACERFYEQDTPVRTVSRAQVRQPVNAAGLGRWRAYEKHLQPLIASLAEAGALPEA